MYLLTEQQTDFILENLQQGGISTPGLRQELLDHICAIIEERLEDGGDFESLFGDVIRSFYRRRLSEIEEATEMAVNHRRRFAVIGRGWFFLMLFLLITGPVMWYDLHWLFTFGPAAGYRIPLVVWGGSMVYILFPLLTWLVVLLTPDRFDPLIPRGARIAIGWRPFIRLLAES